MPELRKSLQKAPALKYLSMSSHTATSGYDGSVLEPLGSNPHVEIIQVRSLGVYTLPKFRERCGELAKTKIHIGEGKK